MTKIFEAKNHLLIDTNKFNPDTHSHKAAHIIISCKEKIHVIAGRQQYMCYGIMIPSGTVHKINILDNRVLTFLYDNTSEIAQQITSVQVIDNYVCKKIISTYYNNPMDYNIFHANFLEVLDLKNTNISLTDSRIATATEFIRKSCKDNITRKMVADYVFLSEDRFSHLFKKHIGMTFSAYLIYQRIITAYTAIFKGKSVTEAAVSAGFFSSSHFADVNRRVFGLSATEICSNTQFIKIS